MRFVRIVLAVAAGLIALLVVAVAVLVATVDTRTLLGPLQARIKSETGRDLVIAGSVDYKVSLEPTLVASDVTLGNAPWGKAPHLLHAKSIELKVALMPLLHRRIELIEFALVEPAIALETDAKGRGNWEMTALPTSPAPPSPGDAAAAVAIGLGNLSLRNGLLTFLDGASGKTTEAVIERLEFHARSSASPIDAEFKGKVGDTAIALKGTLAPLDALRAQQGPYPASVKGEVAGKPATFSASITRQDGVTTLDALDFAWGTLAAKGRVRITTTGGRTKYVFSLAAPAWSPADAAIATGAALGAEKPKPNAPSRYLIPDQALPLDGLKAFDAEGDLSVATLMLDDKFRLQAVTMKIVLQQGRLDVPALQAQGFGGTLRGKLAIDAARAGAPGVSLKFDGQDLDLAAILAALGTPRSLKGGKTKVAVDIASRGSSLHQWAASATGQATASVGATTLVNTKLDLDNVLDKVVQALNPFRERDPSTELVCAVVRLPLVNGIAKVDRSIAMETRKLGVSASGTLDFREERLDLTFRPKVRQGIPIDIPKFAELVRLSGPFAHPAMSIDPAGSAMTVAKIGAAIGTGGLSILGTSIVAGVVDHGDLCEMAMGGKSPAKTPESGGKPTPSARTKR